MRIMIAGIAVVICVGICAGVWGAQSFAIGRSTLAARVIELDGQSLSAKGNARLTMAPSTTPLEVGQVRLESITSQDITVGLAQDKGGKLSMKNASATGGVVVRAKRADRDTDKSGKAITAIRDMQATAKIAEMPQSQDVIKLSGDVAVKITEPGVAEPIAVITGDVVTMSLKSSKIRIEGRDEKPAEFSVTPKGEQK